MAIESCGDDEEQELINKKVIASKRGKAASTTKNQSNKRKPNSPSESEEYENEEKSENEVEDVAEVETDSSEQPKGSKTLTKKEKATVSKEKKSKSTSESELSENEMDEEAVTDKKPESRKSLTKKRKATASKNKPKEKKPKLQTESELSGNETDEEPIAKKKLKESNTLTKKGKSTVSKNRYKDKKPKSPTESELSESETEEEAVAPKESNILTKKGKASVSKNKHKEKKPKSPKESELSENETDEESIAKKKRKVAYFFFKSKQKIHPKIKSPTTKTKHTKIKPKSPTPTTTESENEVEPTNYGNNENGIEYEEVSEDEVPAGIKTITKKGKVSKNKLEEKKLTESEVFENEEISHNETDEEAVSNKKLKSKQKSPTTKTKQKKRKPKSPTPTTTESESEEFENVVEPKNDGNNENEIEYEKQSEAEGPATEPTVKNVVNFKASVDFNLLTKIMSGTHKNQKEVIHLLTKRTNLQRRLIARYFMMEHGRDFVAELRNKFGKSLDDIIIGLMLPPVEYLCRELLKAIKAQDNQPLVEILCTHNNYQVVEIAFTYEIMFRKKLICQLESETEDNFNKFITLIISGNREMPKKTIKKVTTNGIEKNGRETDKETDKKTDKEIAVESAKEKTVELTTTPTEKTPKQIAKEQANALFKAGEEQNGINHEVFSKILACESFKQIKLIMEEYKKVAGRTLEQAIMAEVTGSLHDAYMAVVECAVNRPAYFAKLLNKALHTNDASLKRIIINRSEIDLGNIKKEYEQIYGKNLFTVIKEEVTGDYKKILLPLIGGS